MLQNQSGCIRWAFIAALIWLSVSNCTGSAYGELDFANDRDDLPYLNMFSLNGELNILEEEHLGIFNGKITTNVTFRDVLSFRGLYAPPFASSDFLLRIRLFGEKTATEKYTWYPFEVRRQGKINDVTVLSSLVLIADKRAVALSLTLENQDTSPKIIPLQINIEGGLDYVSFWEFSRPRATKGCKTVCKQGRLFKNNESGSIVIGTDIENLKWKEFSSQWETKLSLASKQRKTFHLVLAIGEKQTAEEQCNSILSNPQKALKISRLKWSEKAADLYTKLPTLKAKDKRLENFYNRSLLHFLLNQWDVPEFLLHPYYSTGSINGGCVCSYLWDFGECWEIFGLYDPKAMREHIKTFLNIDLTSHFAFEPINGKAFGPWYYVNQEKIIFLIYYYVLSTGDVDFLKEEVNGKTIIDWVVYQATYGDDFDKPAVLIDYGKGNHHLELRRQYRYDNYMPDLNARRYANYQAAFGLCKLVKKDVINLQERAEALKVLIKDKMWSKEHKWFFFLDENMDKHIRYTIQMFKLIGSSVLDEEEEKGILSHLNEKEFLSDYGLHSMSKEDVAYDQVDIDNGGGGSYTGFPPQIIERLYKAGYSQQAEDILRRILWWGERLPYWGDSLVANYIDYRKDSPLQNTIGSLAAAQCIIFGMFGVQVNTEGDIVINPVSPAFSPDIKLTGLKIRGFNIDILVRGQKYNVNIDDQAITSEVGVPVLFRIRDKKLKKLNLPHN